MQGRDASPRHSYFEWQAELAARCFAEIQGVPRRGILPGFGRGGQDRLQMRALLLAGHHGHLDVREARAFQKLVQFQFAEPSQRSA